MRHKPRVVILGGGAGGMAAAFELSRDDWQEHFESITVHQLGFRLGGKGACGRGRDGRIEEHGLHIWLGFYHHAFRMMRQCYYELDRPSDVPLARITDAFERSSSFVVEEPRPGGWSPWPAAFPETDEFPGGPGMGSPSLWQCFLRALELAGSFLASTWSNAGPDQPGPVLVPAGDDWSGATHPASGLILEPLRSPLADLVCRLLDIAKRIVSAGEIAIDAGLAAALALATSLDPDPCRHDPHHHRRLLSCIEQVADQAYRRVMSAALASDTIRRDWYLADVLLACARGVLFHCLLTDPEGLDAVDDYDFSDWLIRNGADPAAARSALIKTIVYDMAFAYRQGDPDQPSCSAACALRGLFQFFFSYRGAIAWKMRAGMGDVVFAPLYEVLRGRGVQFEFFHRVDALHLSDDRSRVESIDIGVQVEVRAGPAGYRPLCDVKGLPCWPNHPLTEQLRHAKGLTSADVESFWSTRPDAASVTLRDGEDFDQVVLAIPVGAHPFVCSELIADNRKWSAMVKRLDTVYTQSFQLWLHQPLSELGVTGPPATTGGYLEPFDTYADMRQLIGRENWPPATVQSIAYFCNTMPTPPGLPDPSEHEVPRQAREQVKNNAVTFLEESMAPLWPAGVHRYPTGFRWDLLVGADHLDSPVAFDSQYWTANIDPSERYVLSLPGTTRYRLAPDDSGYDNLLLAGDWTKSGLNAGCIEAAVVSGRMAAQGVRRRCHD